MEITLDPQKEKIGFHKNYISIPNDTLELELFREILPLKLPNRYKHLATKLLV
jgi:hypothetical protein